MLAEVGMADNATILVVEDDLSLMQGIRDILEIKGFQVLTATSGVDGLRVMQGSLLPPDLIVSDIMMPFMNGYEFFNAVRKETRWTKIPFIFLTARGEKTDVRMGKMLGADEYMVKPFEPEDLLVAVTSKLKRSQEIDAVNKGEVSTIKRSILTILNHEFRTPLTYIVAYSDMLNREPDEMNYEEMKTFLQGINTGAERLRRLIENFIILVELQTGEAQTQYNWRKKKFSDLDTIFENALPYVEDAARENGITIEVSWPHGALPQIQGDQDYLRTALIRLLDNAIKFSDKPHSKVYLYTDVVDNRVCIFVRDEGRGIPAEEQQRIWDMFYQINRQQYEDQGSGSGLAIVDQIAKLHGGSINLESEVGVGSTFAICIPVAG